MRAKSLASAQPVGDTQREESDQHAAVDQRLAVVRLHAQQEMHEAEHGDYVEIDRFSPGQCQPSRTVTRRGTVSFLQQEADHAQTRLD